MNNSTMKATTSITASNDKTTTPPSTPTSTPLALPPLDNPTPRDRHWSVFDMTGTNDLVLKPDQPTTVSSSETPLVEEDVDENGVMDHLLRAAEMATSVKAVPKMNADGSVMRRGKWSEEEQDYSASLVKFFMAGLLEIPHGQTLRAYLAVQLACDPMRVSKKLAGKYIAGIPLERKLGKRSFVPKEEVPAGVRTKIKSELDFLQARFNARVAKDACDEEVAAVSTLGKRKMDRRKSVRMGPWAEEEEAYALALLQYFAAGLLNVPPGTTMRSYLASMIRCDPMRVSKKLAACKLNNVEIPKRAGTRVYEPQAVEEMIEQRVKAQTHLKFLRTAYLKIIGLENEPIAEPDVDEDVDDDNHYVNTLQKSLKKKGQDDTWMATLEAHVSTNPMTTTTLV